jgi:hypothetical protein
MISLYFPKSYIDTILHKVAMSPLALLGCDSFSDFLFFFLMTLTILKSPGQAFGSMFFFWNFSDVALKIRLEFWVLVRETPEVKFLSHQITSRNHSINLSLLCWVWSPVKQFATFFQHVVTLYHAFHLVPLEGGNYEQPIWSDSYFRFSAKEF